MTWEDTLDPARNPVTPRVHHEHMAAPTDPMLDLELDLDHVSEAPQQLSLLPSSSVPVRFRLDRRTRELGLANIARIRRQLAERAAARPEERVPARRPQAA